MKKLWNRINPTVFFIIVICFFLYLPSFFTFFSQDDFIHLSFSLYRDQVLKAFNLFAKGDFPFFRPIPTQVYFYINHLLFGFKPFGYHVINFLIYSLNIIIIFHLIKKLTNSSIIPSIAIIFFAVNSTHFASLYSPAYVHELLYVMFASLTLYFYVSFIYCRTDYHFLLSVGFFILALMSKETAVMIPFILFISSFFVANKLTNREKLETLIPFGLILSVYIYGHFVYYGLANSPSYEIILGKPTFNILGWYFLWALSTPNILIDFVGPGLKINPVFFQVSGISGWVYIILFPIFILLGLILLLQSKLFINRKKWNKTAKLILFGFLWFVVGLVPLIIFPLHKLATEQAFSLVGLSLALAILVFIAKNLPNRIQFLSYGFVLVFIIISVNSIFLANRTHWIIRSALQAESVINYFRQNYPNIKDNQVIYFKNGTVKIPQYGSSRQIYQSLGNGVALSLLYNKPNLRLYFEENEQIPIELERKSDTIVIDSSKFLGY